MERIQRTCNQLVATVVEVAAPSLEPGVGPRGQTEHVSQVEYSLRPPCATRRSRTGSPSIRKFVCCTGPGQMDPDGPGVFRNFFDNMCIKGCQLGARAVRACAGPHLQSKTGVVLLSNMYQGGGAARRTKRSFL